MAHDGLDGAGPTGPAAPDRVAVVLSVDPERLDDVLAASSGAGLEDAQPLAAVGVITGRIHPDRVARLEALDGVQAVEVERRFQLPPPDAPVQ